MVQSIIQMKTFDYYIQLPLPSTETMKIIDLIRSITSRITHTVLEFIHPTKLKEKRIRLDTSQRNKVKQKTGRKRKSFHSFLREDKSEILQRSTRRKRKQAVQAAPQEQEEQFQKQSVNQSNFSSQEQQMEQKMTNEAPPPAAPLFIDQDGLEISIIEQKDNKFDQLSNSAESDSEILKFVFGEEEWEPKRQPSTKTHVNEQPFVERKEWWKQALEQNSLKSVDSALNERVSTVKEAASSLKGSEYESAGSVRVKKIKTKLIRHPVRPKGLKRYGLRIINIIDLVENEDNPKLFVVPLKQG